jgi:hypothetical protein
MEMAIPPKDSQAALSDVVAHSGNRRLADNASKASGLHPVCS